MHVTACPSAPSQARPPRDTFYMSKMNQLESSPGPNPAPRAASGAAGWSPPVDAELTNFSQLGHALIALFQARVRGGSDHQLGVGVGLGLGFLTLI